MSGGAPIAMPSAPIGIGPVVRPVTSFAGRLTGVLMGHLEPAFGLVRALAPILALRNFVLVSRYDDVREILLMDPAFGVPYGPKLDVIMGGKPFFLGMEDTSTYRRQVGAMRAVVRQDDIDKKIAPAVEARVHATLAAAGGEIDVVQLVRSIVFDVLLDYFGVPPTPPALGDITLWATRIFEFQFVDQGNDPALREQIALICPALITHIREAIAARVQSGAEVDDVLGRCLERQAANVPGYSTDEIVCALVGFIGGGIPQLPMAAPQILDQLLRRGEVLAAAGRAARAGDDAMLRGYALEALRFDGLAKVLQRVATRDYTLAAGTHRARSIKAGTPVLLCPASAMMDGRRIADPRAFDPTRSDQSFLHFGLGHHQCFGMHINLAVLPAVLKPLLAMQNLRRADGLKGRLRKQGVFPDRLVVNY